MKSGSSEKATAGSDSWRLVGVILVVASALYITATYFMMY